MQKRKSGFFLCSLVLLVVVVALEWTVVVPFQKLPSSFLQKPHIVGHNGAGENYPEDTIEALEIAVKKYGCTILEVDVQLSKDGHLVCIHDSSVDRTTNGTGLVSQFTLEELQSLEAAQKYPDFINKGVKIPSLEQVVNWFLQQEDHILLLIEMKPPTKPHTLAQVKQFFDKYPILYERAIVSAFEPHALHKLRRMDSKISTALISGHMLVSGGCKFKVLPSGFCGYMEQLGAIWYLDQFALTLTKTVIPHFIGNGGFILHMNSTSESEAVDYLKDGVWLDVWGIKEASTMKSYLQVGASVAPDILHKIDVE
jgi:glycerophosphoryl diester phosphodiesterase